MSALQTNADPGVEVLDLRQISGRDLEPLLDEEIEVWRSLFHWDFTPSAELVLRFVNMQALAGYALVIGGVVRGYSYFITEDHKGLIGDVFLTRSCRTSDFENLLLQADLQALLQDKSIRRIETQLMMLSAPFQRNVPFNRRVQTFRRTFMARLMGGGAMAPGTASQYVTFDHWNDAHQNSAAHLISACYRGHVDSEINDQYRSVSGARRFLVNLIQYPGCGRFFRPASMVALRKDNAEPCGIVLASLVSETVGHITQLCVSPAARHYGIGYELIRRALQELEQQGCREVSLTVTSSNDSAIRLYERMNFTRRLEFAAHVWDVV